MSLEITEIETHLACCTAEILAFPQACLRRECRRANRCLHVNIDTGAPACLINFGPEYPESFTLIYLIALAARAELGRHGMMFASPSASERELQDACVEVARNALPDEDAKRWMAAYRAREKLPPPTLP
ncbi:hypothetical protein [Rhizobium sp. NFR12]|uniref:hypothetical protein n=1 Tax=Rhizobium sp. NFR12 TaxID=1566261 RepID=UPI0008A7B220|nr:hypothetical protein [Rhizobium sp. NFR12]SEH22849.1 hypothetical protein SAMN03159407_1399 [Rhizobium sp. NFR12]